MSDGPIITEELWNRWHKTKEKEEIDFNNIEETFKDDFKNFRNNDCRNKCNRCNYWKI